MGNSKSKSEQTFRSRSSPRGIVVDINGKVYNDVSPSSANNIHFNKPDTNTAFSNYNDYKSYPKFERKQYSVHEIDKSHKLTFNDTIIQSKFVTETCEKEKYNNENQTNEPKNKLAIAAPHKISTKDDFMTEWFSWKDEFLKYMKSIDQAESNKQDWGIMLLNRMGPIGQEIYRTFISDKDDAKDIDALLKQFDFYCIFGGRRRGDDEDIDEYVNNLMVMASKHMASTHEVVKEKILMEIDKGKFTRKAENLILGFSFPSSIQSLTVKEITYIWMLYENVNFKRSEEIHNFIVKNCNNCGRTHKMYNCYARGKRCNKCGNENHYWTRCPSQFIDNCLYCGEAHFVRECPAYLNECNKCNRTNHFSWKCSLSTVLNCNYCGLTHIASRSACSAANTICFICNRRGHVPSKCFKKSTYR